MNKLNMKALALSLGITMSLSVLILGWVAIGGWGTFVVEVMSSLYVGYDATFWGAIIGAIWAFFDGAIIGILISWFYQMFANPSVKVKVVSKTKKPIEKEATAKTKAKTKAKSKKKVA